MPILECQSEGKSGHKFGESGKCFTGSGSRAKAARQGRAIKARQAATGRKVAEERAAQFGKTGHLPGKKRRRRMKSPVFDQHKEREMARRGQTQTTDRTQFEVDEVRFGKRGLNDLRERRRLHRINRRRERLGRPLLGVGPDVTFAFRDLSSAGLEDGGKLVAEQGLPKKKRRGLGALFRRQSEAPREEAFATGPTPVDDQDAGLILPASLRGKAKQERSDALARLFATDAAGLMAEGNVGLAEKGEKCLGPLAKEDGLEILRAMSRITLAIRTPDLKKVEKGESESTRVDPCRLKKIDHEKQLVWGEVYIPLLPDSQGDFMTAEEIEKAAYRFAAQGRLNQIDCMHDGDTDNSVCVVETFIARAEDPIFIEGAWVICCHIPDKGIWEGVKSGKFNGFSMEGLAVRHEKQFEIDLPETVAGVTQSEEGHTHPFHIKFSPQGEFLGGLAEPEGAQGSDIHSHGIQKGTITEVGGATPHVHRYSFVEGVLEVAIGRVPPSPEQVVQAG